MRRRFARVSMGAHCFPFKFSIEYDCIRRVRGKINNNSEDNDNDNDDNDNNNTSEGVGITNWTKKELRKID